MRGKEPRGFRRKRLPQSEPDPLTHLHSRDALVENIIGADLLGQIAAEAAAQAPLPDPEDLLLMWAEQYYNGGSDFFIWQIGYYVAEDLKLRGLVRDHREST